MVYKHAIFMRLGIHLTSGLDGLHTIREYEVFVAQHGEAWFPVATGAGMSERMRCEFQDAIDYHYALELYFSLGRVNGGDGDIARKADVVGIARSRVPIPSPDPALTPVPFSGDVRATWLKITNIRPADVSAGNFIIINTGRNLAHALEQGQYHFGYVKRVGEAI
jgi:hypothetical protein